MPRLGPQPEIFSATDPPAETGAVVLGGGGARCVATFGFLSSMPEGWRRRVRHVHAVSGGSVVALLFALGLSPEAAMGLAVRHLTAPFSAPLDLDRLLQRRGLCVTSPCEDLVREAISDWWWGECLRGRQDLPPREPPRTLLQLAQATGRFLHIYVTDTATMESVVLSPETAPDVDVVEAVCASCAVPLIMCPVQIRGMPSLYIDGAVTRPVPVPTPAQLRAYGHTLALTVEDEATPQPRPPGLVSYVWDVMCALLRPRAQSDPAQGLTVLRVPAGRRGMCDMMLRGSSAEDLQALFAGGVQAARNFRATHGQESRG